MANNFSVDSRKFMQAMTGLQKATGAPMKEVTRAEAGSILKRCAGWTKVATQAKVKTFARLHALRDLELTGKHGVTINAGLKGANGYGATYLRTSKGLWRRTHNEGYKKVAGMPNGNRKKSGDHYAKYDWLLVQDAISQAKKLVKDYVSKAKESIGLARQSWVQIGDSIGIDIGSVPGKGISPAGAAKARAAIASDGRYYMNGQAKQYADAKQCIISLVNSLPFCRRAKFDKMIIRAMNGRSSAYAQNLKRGVFKSYAAIARQYPGIKISSN